MNKGAQLDEFESEPFVTRLIVGPEAPQRLDHFLVLEGLREVSRSALQRLVGAGLVEVNGKVVTKSGFLLNPGDEVLVSGDLVPRPAVLVPAAVDLSVVYEDQHLWVIDKQPGLVVHPGAGTANLPTLIEGLLGRHQDSPPEVFREGGLRPGIVHRLDKDTSGLLVVAKTLAAYSGLVRQFSERTAKRAYLALASSTPRHRGLFGSSDEGVISAPIGRHPSERTKMAVVASGGKPATTRWRIIARGEWGVLCAVFLDTGRTHQVRVHFAHCGAPLVGDPMYGNLTQQPQALRPLVQRLGRQALHAFRLSLRHPITGEMLAFRSALTPDIGAVVAGYLPDFDVRGLDEWKGE